MYHTIKKIFAIAKSTINIIVCCLFVPLIIVVRVVRPIKLIRFGHIRSDVLGHLVLDPEYYLSEREVKKDTSLDLFYFLTKIHPNNHWPLMLNRHLRINALYRYLDRVNRFIPSGQIHHKNLSSTGSRDLQGYSTKTDVHVKFTPEENQSARSYLKDLGLDESDRYVCLIVRDSAYKEKHQNWKQDWSYHSYRDSDIDTYESAALKLADKGYWVLRMGKAVKKPLKLNHTRIVDYANSVYRSDFLDIWLTANCSFALMTNTGIADVVYIYRRPTALVNALPLGHINTTLNSVSMWLPKTIVWAKNNNPLTLREQIDTGVIGFIRTDQYEQAGVLIVDNSSQAIIDTVLELEFKLTGRWEAEPVDALNQDKFWQILQTWEQFSKFHGQPKSRMPDSFLRLNSEWFLT